MAKQEQASPVAGVGRNIWSVVAGLLVAFLWPALAFTLVAFNFSAEYRLPTAGPPPGWITQTYVLASILGTLAGGYVTARLARRVWLRNVLILTLLWFAFQLGFWRVPANPFLFETVRLAIISSMALLGGYVQRGIVDKRAVLKEPTGMPSSIP